MAEQDEGGRRVGGLPWRSPQVVATVTTGEDLVWLRKHAAEVGADLLEFRLDDLMGEEEALEGLLGEMPLHCLLTARHPEEGGRHGLSEERRLELLDRFWRPGMGIDLEVRTLRRSGKARELARKVRSGGGWVVASHHDFEGMPGDEVLEGILAEGGEQEVDVVKVAVVLRTSEELCRLTSWAAKAERPVSVMGMGPLGKLSRLVLGYEVSQLNYGYLRQANASGQWSAAELKQLLEKLRS